MWINQYVNNCLCKIDCPNTSIFISLSSRNCLALSKETFLSRSLVYSANAFNPIIGIKQTTCARVLSCRFKLEWTRRTKAASELASLLESEDRSIPSAQGPTTFCTYAPANPKVLPRLKIGYFPPICDDLGFIREETERIGRRKKVRIKDDGPFAICPRFDHLWSYCADETKGPTRVCRASPPPIKGLPVVRPLWKTIKPWRTNKVHASWPKFRLIFPLSLYTSHFL